MNADSAREEHAMGIPRWVAGTATAVVTATMSMIAAGGRSPRSRFRRWRASVGIAVPMVLVAGLLVAVPAPDASAAPTTGSIPRDSFDRVLSPPSAETRDNPNYRKILAHPL